MFQPHRRVRVRARTIGLSYFLASHLSRGRAATLRVRVDDNPLSRQSILATITFSLRPALTTTGRDGGAFKITVYALYSASR